MDQPGCFYPRQFCISTREKCNPWERCVLKTDCTPPSHAIPRAELDVNRATTTRKIKLYIASNFNIPILPAKFSI